MGTNQFIRVNLEDKIHSQQVLKLLNAYMVDPMGNGKQMDNSQEAQIISGLKEHPAYIGFFVLSNGHYAALANCNLVFSTWQAKKIINIHDLIVLPDFRKRGIGLFMLNNIKEYAKGLDCCKVNLEVREDNLKAQSLYKNVGFDECQPKNFFWEVWL